MSSKSRIESIAHTKVQHAGLKSLSFRTLGAEVGVKSSSVHYHFPEKSDLGQALIVRHRNGLAKFLRETAEQSPTVHASIKQFNHTFVELCYQGQFCIAGMLAAEVESLTEQNRESLNALFDDMHNWLVQEFNRASGELTVGLPSSTLARVLLASLEGALLMDRPQRSEHNLDAVNILVDSWFGKIN